jgi:biotin carboxyl carrier protein
MGKKFKVKVNGEIFDVEVEEVGKTNTAPQTNIAAAAPKRSEAPTTTTVTEKESKASNIKKEEKKEVNTAGKQVVAAPLPGKVLSVNVKKGDTVKKGDLLLVIEAMKMENNILSSKDGIVKAINVSKGQEVEVGAPLIVIE